MPQSKSYIPAKVFISYATIAALVVSVGWLIFNENNKYAAAESRLAQENNKLVKVGNLLSHIYRTENLSRVAIQTATDADYRNYVSETVLVNGEIDSLKLYVGTNRQELMLDSVKILLDRKTDNIRKLKDIKRKAVDETALKRAISDITVMEDSLRKLRVGDFVQDEGELQDYQRRVLTKYIDYLNQNIPDDKTNTLSRRALDSMLLVSRSLLKNVSANLERRRAALNTEERNLLRNEFAISDQLQKVLSAIEKDIFISTAKSNAEKDRLMQKTNTILTAASITGLILTLFFIALISTDFSKTQLYKKQLEAAQVRLASLLKNREQLITTVSHDLKTPLSTIIGYSALLQKTPLDSKQMHYNQNIRGSSEYISKLVQDLLDFTKIEAGKITVDSIPFSLPSVVEEIAEGISSVHRDKPVELTVEIDPVFGKRIVGDPFRIRQILTNLLGNAYKFTAQGFIRIVAQQDNSDLLLSIQDSGIGIAAENQKAVFEEFTQADDKIEKQYGGTGLGLTISKMIAEILGGTLSLQSEPGKGSTFQLRLPLIFDAATTERVLPTGGISPLRLIVIDDDPNLLTMTTAILKQSGYVVYPFTTAVEALDNIKALPYDLVITDIQMPGLDGFGFIKELSDKPEYGYCRQPIVAVTGNSEIAASEYLTAGFSTVLRKPFRPEDLTSAIKALHSGNTIDEKYLPNDHLPGNVQNLYDLTAIRSMFKDDENAVRDILASLYSSTTANLEKLEEAIVNNNRIVISAQIHRMLPMFRQIGADYVVAALTEIEEHAGEVPDPASLLKNLKVQMELLFSQLHRDSVI